MFVRIFTDFFVSLQIEFHVSTMSNLDTIKLPIANEWQEFETMFSAVFESSDALLSAALAYVKQRKGKQIRPILTLLSAKIAGEITQKTHLAATALEVLHTGSLLHDDVVDETHERRGVPSLNSKFDNRTAVLVGDYLLTKSMNCMAQTHHDDLITCFVNLGEEITRGELLQLQNAFKPTAEHAYFETIRRKTAALFATCTLSGAISANATPEHQTALQLFGENLGICFQIKDDIFDYTPQTQVGKPTLNDIREGKFTLPIIHAMKKASENDKNRIFEIAKNADLIEENREFLYQFVEENGGLIYAQQKMEEFRQKAIDCLTIFPDSETKKSLLDVLEFVLERKH